MPNAKAQSREAHESSHKLPGTPPRFHPYTLMHPDLIQHLTLPGGGTPLQLASVAAWRGGAVWQGSVLAPGQGLYEIHEGILDLLPQGPGSLSPAQRSNGWTGTAWGYERPWRINSLTLLSGQPFPFAREWALLMTMLGSVEGGLWLDLGASTALYGRWLAPQLVPHGGTVVALDLAWPMLRRAHALAAAEGVQNLALVCGRGEGLPCAGGSLAGVVCGGSLNEFGERGVERVLGEVARTLRPGGAALFMHLLRAEEGSGALVQRALTRASGLAFWSRVETDRLFARAGLHVEAREGVGAVAFTRVVRQG